jgi:hypothetical protein
LTKFVKEQYCNLQRQSYQAGVKIIAQLSCEKLNPKFGLPLKTAQSKQKQKYLYFI